MIFLWPELMLEVKETLLEEKKANGTMLGSNFIVSIIFVSECTLSLKKLIKKEIHFVY